MNTDLLASGSRGVPVVTRDEMREIDRLSIERYGTVGEILMERAGAAVTLLLFERFTPLLERGVVLLAGKGNNGGDALVVARLLRERRIPCTVFLAARHEDLQGDAALNLHRLERSGHRVREIEEVGLTGLAAALERAGVAIDGLLGTGTRGAVRGPMAEIIEVMNGCPCPIVAIDVPSGLDVDVGAASGPVIQATVTVTLGYPKVGLLVHPGVELAGDVVVGDIGLAPEAVAEVGPRHLLLTDGILAASLPPRAPDTHKGTYGHVLVTGGSAGKTGAIALTGRAALRAGAGLVTVASSSPTLLAVNVSTPELMTEALPGRDGQLAFSRSEASVVEAILEGKDAVVHGPGLGTSAEARALTEWLIRTSSVPLVVDADGLNVLSGHLGWLARKKAPIVLTPHPGEMARLAGSTTGEVQQDRLGVARDFATRHDVVLVLKGSRTLIASPDGTVAINPTGNPGMASGGMGDVLAGILGAILAQGVPASTAARAAVFWHGRAGDRLALLHGPIGILATDVLEELPATLRDVHVAAFEQLSDDDR